MMTLFPRNHKLIVFGNASTLHSRETFEFKGEPTNWFGTFVVGGTATMKIILLLFFIKSYFFIYPSYIVSFIK